MGNAVISEGGKRYTIIVFLKLRFVVVVFFFGFYSVCLFYLFSTEIHPKFYGARIFIYLYFYSFFKPLKKIHFNSVFSIYCIMNVCACVCALNAFYIATVCQLLWISVIFIFNYHKPQNGLTEIHTKSPKYLPTLF